MSAYLSGQVDALNSGVTELQGQILALPTNADLAIYTSMINGRLNTIEANQVDDSNNINLLLQQFSNLKDTILNIDSLLNTHTGYTTGDGVHGHEQ